MTYDVTYGIVTDLGPINYWSGFVEYHRPIIRGHFLHQIQSIQCYLLSPIKNHALHVFIRQKGTVDVIYTPIFWFLGKKTLSIFFVQSLDRFQTKVLIF